MSKYPGHLTIIHQKQ